MKKLDVDVTLLDDLDPEIRSIMKRFVMDGFAVFTDNGLNNRVSRAAHDLRRQKVLVTSKDRSTDLHVLSINHNIMGVENLIKVNWKHIVRGLK